MNNDKKTQYIKIKDSIFGKDPENKPKKKKKKAEKSTALKRTGSVLSVAGTTILVVVLITIITMCIVATAFTVYIMQFSEDSFDVDLRDVELSYSSFIYANDKNGEPVEVKRISSDQNRIWVDIEEIPQHVLDAVIAVEDERFMDHDGVDWKRTVKVTIDALFSGGTAGGSTITQQLVRDVTKDNDVTVGRKLREIFRAMSLEKKYTKIDILESYLNRIGFGGTTYGIGSAAKHYFDKEIKDVTVAEAAILAGMIRSPSYYNPYSSLQQAKTRQKYALEHMYDQGYITTKQYEDALVEKVRFRRPVKGSDFGYVDERYNDYYGIIDETDTDLYYENVPWEEIKEDIPYKWNGGYEVTQNWYVDAAINQVIDHLAESRGIDKETARQLLRTGGYSIYLNMDTEMQDMVTKKFEDPYLCLSRYNENADKKDLLQTAFVIMDYRGNVKAIAGGLGEKEGDDCFNRASHSIRSIGSTIKPLAVYSLAVDMNLITYSTMLHDVSGKIKVYPGDPLATPANGYNKADGTIRWPHNYQEAGFGSGSHIPAWYAVQKSTNTIAVRVLDMVGLKNAYFHLEQRLGFDTLDYDYDLAYSPLALGALTNGARLTDLAAAYQVMGNGGLYYEPYFYSKVTDKDGNVVLEQETSGTQAISSESAWITNRMMLKVVEDPAGSGQYSKIPGVDIIGKTGTSNDMSNLTYVGLCPQYVGVYRIGYDDNREVGKGDGWKTLAKVWHDVMVDIIDVEKNANFTPDPTVLTLNYCTETGLRASKQCPSQNVGYYRKDNIPIVCYSKHDKTFWENKKDEVPVYG